VDPVPDPLLLRKSGSAINGTRDLWEYTALYPMKIELVNRLPCLFAENVVQHFLNLYK
jgi:hypothetical protein